MIEVFGLTKSFGTIRALDDFSCRIQASAITVISGADGAGKSTFFKILIGLLHSDKGQVLLAGKEITNRQALTGICGYMPENFSLYPDLSVSENLDFFAAIHGIDRRESMRRQNELLERTGMSPFKKRRVSELSGGMKQKLSLMTILLPSPRLLILDEPTTGIDPQSRVELFAVLSELKNQGCTVLLSTPYLDEAEKADYVILIRKGKNLRNGSPETLRRQLPANVFRLETEGNPLQTMIACTATQPRLLDELYVRGRYLVYMQSSKENFMHLIPHRRCHRDEPRLEDVYVYYERRTPAE